MRVAPLVLVLSGCLNTTGLQELKPDASASADGGQLDMAPQLDMPLQLDMAPQLDMPLQLDMAPQLDMALPDLTQPTDQAHIPDLSFCITLCGSSKQGLCCACITRFGGLSNCAPALVGVCRPQGDTLCP